MTSEVTLDVNDINLNRAVEKMTNGEFRIPEFQREYVWSKSDVTSLFDSIYNSYPIGSVFVWKVPDSMNNFFQNLRDLNQPTLEDTEREISFVLDGQQRLTSLYIGLLGLEFKEYDYSRVLFDINREEFTLGSGNADHLVSMSDVWDDDRRMDIMDEVDNDQFKRIQRCANQFRNYKIPLIEIDTDQFDEVIDVFERINQSGEDLSRFDIVHANLWREDFNLRRRIDNDIIEPLEDKNFGTVSRETVAEALSLAIEGNSSTNTQKSLDSEKVRESWPDLKDAFMNSVRYIRRRYNIKRVEFLPYEDLIAILAYYMYKADSDTVKSRHQEQIDRYFWRVVFSDHWERGRQTTISSDVSIIDSIISGVNVDVSFPPSITPENLKEANIKRSSSRIRNAFLCILANNEPLNFEDGTPIDLSKGHYTNYRLENHHIFPNSFLRQIGFDKQMRKSVVDITFLPQNINREISDRAPSEYFADYKDRDDFDEIMASHFIPYGEGSAIWDDDYEKFLEQRCNIIMERIQTLIGGTGDIDQEAQTTEQLISGAKKEIRDIIHSRLMNANGESYWGVLPSSAVDAADTRMNGDAENNREKLEFVEMSEAAEIIKIHWSEFSDVFPDRDDVEYHLKNLEHYELAYEDGDVDRYRKLDGDLAVQWIQSCTQEAE
ncbi:DUF262 domain-containing protein [Halomicroarcula sp. F28]|uniref:GmrSD restriction endonuclease domain-containing protein n=1 Tax=Haloarcula salinisoli TaxID=2487746 RepID=UPI001C73333A|nr:DUF262 domain-containing protein [Halomicroarcula salinisoli]MBX0284745.1 DUF262 domain-containing protein [Halomicroarcula salinisoli]